MTPRSVLLLLLVGACDEPPVDPCAEGCPTASAPPPDAVVTVTHALQPGPVSGVTVSPGAWTCQEAPDATRCTAVAGEPGEYRVEAPGLLAQVVTLEGVAPVSASDPCCPPDTRVRDAPAAVALAPVPPLEWTWLPGELVFPRKALHVEDIWLIPARQDQAPLRLEAREGEGAPRWAVDVPYDFVVAELDGAAMVVDGGRIFVAHFHQISTGTELRAFDRESGALLWAEPLDGLGPIAHSRYHNEVQLRIVAGDPVVYGRESAGRYIERRAAATGRRVSSTVLPREP